MKRAAPTLALVAMAGMIVSASGLRGGGFGAAALAQARAPRPNVVVILADDVGYADISAYKINRIPTPNIDKLGHQGVIFTDGYVSAPVCGPSRAGLNTGRYQERFGFEFNNGPAKREVEENLGLPVGELTLAKAMQGVGYHTGLIGKWHLGSNDPYYPTNRGYDEFVGFLPGQTAYMPSTTPGLHISRGVDASEGAGGAGGVDRNRYTQILEGPNRSVVHNESQYLTDYFGDRAVDYIRRNAKAAKPYFLYLAPNAAHAPIEVTQKYYDRFPNIKDERSRIYAGMVSALDDMVGRVTKAIDDSGQANNTLVYFLSDNGCAAYYTGMCSCEPLRGGKLTHYEGGTRVPMMMRWPAVLKGGQVNHQIVSSLDIFPTALDAAGGHLPTDRIYDGVDIIPFLTGKKPGQQPHDMLMWRRRPMASIRKGDWKLWKSLDGKFTLLFDLKTDLNETTNLADKNPAKLKELTDAYDQWSKDMVDPKWPSRPAITYDVCGTPFTVPI